VVGSGSPAALTTENTEQDNPAVPDLGPWYRNPVLAAGGPGSASIRRALPLDGGTGFEGPLVVWIGSRDEHAETVQTIADNSDRH
jgi:hypothetical protein